MRARSFLAGLAALAILAGGYAGEPGATAPTSTPTVDSEGAAGEASGDEACVGEPAGEVTRVTAGRPYRLTAEVDLALRGADPGSEPPSAGLSRVVEDGQAEPFDVVLGDQVDGVSQTFTVVQVCEDSVALAPA